jgi:hypothetical protein
MERYKLKWIGAVFASTSGSFFKLNQWKSKDISTSH